MWSNAKRKPCRTLILQGFLLVGLAGFEPADAGVKVLCLTAWRQPNLKKKANSQKEFAFFINGVGDGTRTHDTQIHNLVL